MPGGPWAAAGSAWGDTEVMLQQGTGYGARHRAFRVWPLAAPARPRTLGCSHPAPARQCAQGTALGSRIRWGSWVPKLPGVTPSAQTHGGVPAPCVPGGLWCTDLAHGRALCPQTPCRLCRAPSCPAQSGPTPVGVTGVPGGPSTGPRPPREGSQELQSQLGKVVPATGWGPTVKFRLELPFVLPSRPVPPAPSLAGAGSEPSPGAAQTHLSRPRTGASRGRGARGGGGRRGSAPPPAPLQATPRRQARRCGAACRRGGPRAPRAPGTSRPAASGAAEAGGEGSAGPAAPRAGGQQ